MIGSTRPWSVWPVARLALVLVLSAVCLGAVVWSLIVAVAHYY